MNIITFEQEQWVDKEVNEVFNFFKEVKNLEFITPEYLNFKILNMNTKEVEKNSIINYRLKLHGIPFKWQTRIKDFVDGEMFIDEQLKGPYKSWIHTHTFFSKEGGTLIKDHVAYEIPFGFLGKFFMSAYIKSDLNKIFTHRRKVIDNYFRK